MPFPIGPPDIWNVPHMPDHPNILFLHSHNTGQFVQPHGHAVPTPNLQRLAEQGVLFRKAFATAPTCSPSRASFLSGKYPHTCGMLGLAHRGFEMADYDLHVVRHLKKHGYVTALAGVEHTAPEPETIGYDRILTGYDTNYPHTKDHRDITEASVDFLRKAGDQPFFLSVGLNETHRPFHDAEPERYPGEDARYCQPPAPLPDTPETRDDTANYKASARVMDRSYGRILDALDEAGQTDNTLVFCFADHGLQFPRHMCNLTDTGIGVYCVARGPAGFTGGKVVDAMVSLMDLVPTACDVAGIDAPASAEGRSLRPLVNGETDALHEQIFAEVNYHAAYEPQRCVRTDRYKYIRRYDGRERVVLPNADEGPSKNALLVREWERQPRDQEMLFDLAFDPFETHNIIDRADMRDVAADLRQRLDQWMRETNDPALPTGDVPGPSGALVNDPDGRSPKETPHAIN